MEACAIKEAGVNIAFSSSAPLECREELEELLFFNPRQHKVREGILDSLAQFGHPRVEKAADRLVVRVGEQEAQTLFAFDQERLSRAPVGAVVFLRTNTEEIAIIHVAVEDSYALQSKSTGVGLGVTLVEKVKEIARRIAGVKRLVFFYRQHVVIRVNP